MAGSGIRLQAIWQVDPRWEGIARPHLARAVEKMRGTVCVELTSAQMGAERLWSLSLSESCVQALVAWNERQASYPSVAETLPAGITDCQGALGASSARNLAWGARRVLRRADQFGRAGNANRAERLAPAVIVPGL